MVFFREHFENILLCQWICEARIISRKLVMVSLCFRVPQETWLLVLPYVSPTFQTSLSLLKFLHPLLSLPVNTDKHPPHFRKYRLMDLACKHTVRRLRHEWCLKFTTWACLFKAWRDGEADGASCLPSRAMCLLRSARLRKAANPQKGRTAWCSAVFSPSLSSTSFPSCLQVDHKPLVQRASGDINSCAGFAT